jgi:hypothetical protein
MAIILHLQKQWLLDGHCSYKLEKINGVVTSAVIASHIYFMEQLYISSDSSLCFGIVSMHQCGVHLLGLSTFSFDQKCLVWFPNLIYIIMRLFWK